MQENGDRCNVIPMSLTRHRHHRHPSHRCPFEYYGSLYAPRLTGFYLRFSTANRSHVYHVWMTAVDVVSIYFTVSMALRIDCVVQVVSACKFIRENGLSGKDQFKVS